MSELEAGVVGVDSQLLTSFYVDVFGFELTERLEFEAFGTVLKLRRGAARLKLFFPVPAATDRVESEPWHACAGWRYAALYLDTEAQLHAVVDAVSASAGRVLTAPMSHRSDATVALVSDPEGNVWELLWERGGS